MSYISTQVALDMNRDGTININDFILLIKWFICFPGNFLFEWIAKNLPSIAIFFGIHATNYDHSSLYGRMAWVVSFIIWFGSYIAIISFLDHIKK